MAEYETSTITLKDRLEFGFVSLQELSALRKVGMTKIYKDIRAGRLPIEKCGRVNRVRGPDAAAYVPGKGIVAPATDAGAA